MAPRRSTNGLTRERIVSEALELAKHDGVDALTLRPLAARLHVSAPALYRHVASRRALLGLMVERLLAETPAAPSDLPWDDALRTVARRLREVYGPFPGLAGETLAGHVATDCTRAEAGGLVDALADAGMPRAQAEPAIRSVLRWLLSYLAVGSGEREERHDGARDGRTFEEGVELFVAGLRTRIA